MSRMQEGTCHICGTYGKLSYEHVPPQAAFNDKPILYKTILEILQGGNFNGLAGKKLQRGGVTEHCVESVMRPLVIGMAEHLQNGRIKQCVSSRLREVRPL